MLANGLRHVVIDGEAGIEQIQRRVMEKVTHLILIGPEPEGTKVTETIKEVADELVMYDHIGAYHQPGDESELNRYIEIPGVEILAFIRADEGPRGERYPGQERVELPLEFTGALRSEGSAPKNRDL